MEKTLDDICCVLERLTAAVESIATAQTADARRRRLSRPADQPSRDAMAIAWMMTLQKPTKTAIAKAMGYSHAAALVNLHRFNEFYEKFSALQTVTGGFFDRPGPTRRNGRSLEAAQDWKGGIE